MSRLITLVAVVSIFSFGSVHAQVPYTGSPHVIQQLTESAPGTYTYLADYTWAQDTILGEWAQDAWEYTSVSQNTAQPNALNLRTSPAGSLEYRLKVDVDLADIQQIVVTARVRRGVTVRAKAQETDSYGSEGLLLIGTNDYPAQPVSIVLNPSLVNGTTPGQTEFFVRFRNEGGSNLGGLTYFSVEVTEVPEPGTFASIASMGLMLVLRRRPA